MDQIRKLFILANVCAFFVLVYLVIGLWPRWFPPKPKPKPKASPKSVAKSASAKKAISSKAAKPAKSAKPTPKKAPGKPGKKR